MHVLLFLDLMPDWKQLLLFTSTIDCGLQHGHFCWYTRKIALPTLTFYIWEQLKKGNKLILSSVQLNPM